MVVKETASHSGKTKHKKHKSSSSSSEKLFEYSQSILKHIYGSAVYSLFRGTDGFGYGKSKSWETKAEEPKGGQTIGMAVEETVSHSSKKIKLNLKNDRPREGTL